MNDAAYAALDRAIGYTPDPREDPAPWVEVHNALLTIALRDDTGTILRELYAELHARRNHNHDVRGNDPCFFAEDTGCSGQASQIVTITDHNGGRKTVASCDNCMTLLDTGITVERQTPVAIVQRRTKERTQAARAALDMKKTA